eukprot:2966335-Alexandrium_andersonii.AAC.1
MAHSTWCSSQQKKDQGKKAAKQVAATNFPRENTKDQREDFLKGCIDHAGLSGAFNGPDTLDHREGGPFHFT